MVGEINKSELYFSFPGEVDTIHFAKNSSSACLFFVF